MGNLLRLKYDMGVSFAYLIDGLPLVIAGFVIVILIEALFLSEYFERKKSLYYSFVINLISTIIGIPLLSFGGMVYFAGFTFLPFPFYYFGFPALFYFLTVLVEYITFLILFKPNWKKKEMLQTILKLNFYSYLGLFALLFVVWLVHS